MKKSLFSIAFIGLFLQISAQNTGINTTNPKATLDITAKSDGSTQPEGILIPRLTGDQIRLMPIANLQESTMVYATSASNDLSATKDKNLTEKGYFYWSGTAWQNVKGNDWSLTGNAGTDPSVNFVGTTDDKDLVFKRGGSFSGYINKANQNAAFGFNALFSNAVNNTSGWGNIAVGAYALSSNTIGVRNVAIGRSSLTQSKNSENTSIGDYSLPILDSGYRNTAIGVNSGSYLVTGIDNVMVGNNSGFRATGSTNVFLGSFSGNQLSSGSGNVIIGYNTANNITSGSNNIIIGNNLTAPSTVSNYQLSIGNSIYGLNINDGNANNDLIGIQTNAPTNTLHVKGTDPLRLEGLQTSLTATDKVLVTDANGVLKASTTGAPTGFEKITEAGQTGWRLIGRNPLNFGNIGNNAVDASYGTADNTDGARGDYSFASGFNTVAANTGTVAMGYQSTAGGQYGVAIGYQSKANALGSVALGYQNTSNSNTSFTAGSGNTSGGGGSVALGINNTTFGIASISLGKSNKTNADSSIALGDNITTKNMAEVAVGSFNTLDATSDTTFSQNSRRLFTVGNGTSSGTLSDALTVLRNGKVGIDIDNFETTTSAAKLQVNGDIQSLTINANSSTISTDKVVVADANGVLKTKDASALAAGNFWGLTGNANTTPGTNFIGTTDNQNLLFKRNNNPAGSVEEQITSLGYNSLKEKYLNNYLIPYTVAIGDMSLQNLQGGSYNVAVGTGTLWAAKSSIANTAIGQQALESAEYTGNNTALGAYALQNVVGNNNIGIGVNVTLNNNAESNQLSIGNSIYGLNINDGNATNDLVGIQTSNPNSTLQVSGSLSASIRTVGTYTATSTDYTLIATGGNITLPDPTTCAGRMYHIVYKSGTVAVTNPIFVGGTAVTNFGLNSGSGGQALTVQSDGTSWYAISRL